MKEAAKFFFGLFGIFIGALAGGSAVVAAGAWTLNYVAGRYGDVPAVLGLIVGILAVTAGLITLGCWLDGDFS